MFYHKIRCKFFRKRFTKRLIDAGYKCKNNMTQPHIIINVEQKYFFCVHPDNMCLFEKLC